MVFIAANLRKNLLWYKVAHETNSKYAEGIEALSKKGWEIKMLIADGKPGLGKELRDIMFTLKQTDKESFTHWINQWYLKWEKFLDEKVFNLMTGKNYYTHTRLRQAYNSIKRTLPVLFTF